jgi:hypothetical protein
MAHMTDGRVILVAVNDQGSEERRPARRDGIIEYDFHTRYGQIVIMNDANEKFIGGAGIFDCR